MKLNGTKDENFDTIEKAVQDGTIDSVPLEELKRAKQELLTNSPLSDNPKFIQRWERVNAAITSRIESSGAQTRFKVQVTIGVLTLLLVVLNIYLSHGAS